MWRVYLSEINISLNLLNHQPAMVSIPFKQLKRGFVQHEIQFERTQIFDIPFLQIYHG